MPLYGSKPLGARRLQAAVLAIVDARINACREAEARYEGMVAAGGGMLGSVELAKQARATERSARMEAECIRRFVADLPVSKR